MSSRRAVNAACARGVPVTMERRANNVETITLRVRRGNSAAVQHLTLCGHHLLSGHADTGIFQIVRDGAGLATPPPAKPTRVTRRAADDGLAMATIEIAEPLALAEEEGCCDPYGRKATSR